MRIFINAFALIALCLLSACSSDDWDFGGGTEPTPKSITIEIKTGSAVVETGDRVKLSVIEANEGLAISDYKWSFSDGQVLTGKEVEASFPASGIITVKLEALSGATPVASADAQLAVVAPGSLAPAGYSFPETIGDVDGDKALKLEDALLAAQAAEGLIAIDSEQLDNADIDRDGRVDAADIALMQKAVLRGEVLPRAILDQTARPGAVAALISPDLLATTGTVEVRVNGQASPQVLRTIRGYASFVVPKGVVKQASPASVELLVNGAVKDRFPLSILDPVARPADALADVSEFIGELEAGMIAQQDALRAQMSSMSLSDTDSATLLAASNAGVAELRGAREELVTLMSGAQGDAVASRFQQALYANGLDEFRSGSIGPLGLRAMAGTIPDPLCDVILPALCKLKRAGELLGKGADILTKACSVTAAIALAGAISPFDGPLIEGAALTVYVNVCVRLSVAIELGGAVGDIITPIEPGLRVTADKTTLAQDESAIVRTEITFLQIHRLCGLGATKGAAELLNKQIGDRVLKRLWKNNAALSLLARVFAKVGEKPFVKFVEYIQQGVSNAISDTQITNALANFVTGICPTIQTGKAQAVAANILQTPAIDEGLLQFLPDGTARYTCPPPGPVFKSRIDLVGTKELCGGTIARAKVTMTCATSPVTITMGDNGTALDDIYEVVIGGRTVLTSSSPVRSVSTTVHLPRGRTEVIMRGLAAPDGIGTYFINFSGAAVVSGANALSGTDLVPGTSKRFIIEVL